MNLLFLLMDFMENGRVTDNTLLRMQEELYRQHGRKYDLYHSEIHRGLIICEHGQPILTGNRISY